MTTTRKGQLLACSPDGVTVFVPNSYDGIKTAVGENTPFDFIRISVECGYYIDDEGMLNGAALNVPASMFAGRPVWGTGGLTAADTDPEGDTLPPPDAAAASLIALGERWMHVTAGAALVGQDINANQADSATIPPPTVVEMTQAEFDAWINGRR